MESASLVFSDRYLYIQYESILRLLSFTLSLDLYSDCRVENEAAHELARGSNIFLLYKKCLSVLKQREKLCLSIYGRNGSKVQEGIPSYFVNELEDDTSTLNSNETQLILFMKTNLTSSLDPDIALTSVQEGVVRLFETFSTSSHNDVWKEQVLSTTLLCAELWKSMFLKIGGYEDFTSDLHQILRCERTSFLLELLIENLVAQQCGAEHYLFSKSTNDSLLNPTNNGDASFEDMNRLENDLIVQSEPLHLEPVHLEAMHLESVQAALIHSFSDSSDANSQLDWETPETCVSEVLDSECLNKTSIPSNFLRNANVSVSNFIDIPDWIPVVKDTFEHNFRNQRLKKLKEINTMIDHLKSTTEEIAINIQLDTQNFDSIHDRLETTEQYTRKAVVSLAQASKKRNPWWGINGSGAGLIGGSLLSVPFGPVGMIAGASIGGLLGYKSAKQIKGIQDRKADKIVSDMQKT